MRATAKRWTPPLWTAPKSPALLSLHSMEVTGSSGNADSRGQRMAPRPLPISCRLSGATPRSMPRTCCTRGSSVFTLNLCKRRPASSPSTIEAESRPSRPRTNAPASSEKYPSIAVNYDIPMARTKSADGVIVQTLRTIALRHPDTEEGIACNGTAVESSAFKVRKRTFLFARKVDLRLKLLESIPEANQLAAKEPDIY